MRWHLSAAPLHLLRGGEISEGQTDLNPEVASHQRLTIPEKHFHSHGTHLGR